MENYQVSLISLIPFFSVCIWIYVTARWKDEQEDKLVYLFHLLKVQQTRIEELEKIIEKD